MVKIIDVINFFSTFLVLLPLILIIKNSKKIKPLRFLILYLLICFLVESISILNYYIIKANLKYLGVSFVYFEVIFLLFYFKKYQTKIFISILLIISIIYTFIFVLSFIDNNDQLINIIFGGGHIIILLITINNIIESMNKNFDKWFMYLNLSFFLFAVINSCTNSFISFFIENKQYASFYILLLSLSNIILYSGITASLLSCKKKFISV